MFKGYIPTRGKRPTEKVRGRGDFYTLESVQGLHEYGGVLDDDFIMVDIDDAEQATILEKIIDKQGIKCNKLYTSRGIHFYFKNTIVTTNAIAKPTAIGIRADIKLGTKNAVVPLKIDGVEREIIKVAEVDPLPKWLQIVKNPPDFLNMVEGDGRNQTIFNYILKLQAHGFKKDEIKETLLIINDYILKNPLDRNEIETVLRDESFTAPTFFNEKGQLMLDDFCNYIKNEERIIIIGNQLHIYHEGVYTPDRREIERRLIKYIPNCKKQQRNEIIAMLELVAPHRELSKTDYIVVKNGLLNIKTMQLEQFDPNIIVRNKINTVYNPAAKCESMDTMLDNVSCNNADLRALIEEMIGYILLNRNELGKCFILTGDGSNGKSTVLNCIKDMIGRDNISSLGLNELNQRFKTAELYGKLLNIGDDIGNGYIEDNSVFKKLVTGESVTVERKGSDPFDFENYSKLIFACNDMPRINDTSTGLKRRLIIIPFMARFDKNRDKFNPFIIDDLKDPAALEYLLILAIDGLKRILENRAFTQVDAVEAVMHVYERTNNPVLQFIEEVEIEDEVASIIYERYKFWCDNNTYKRLSHIVFGKELAKFGYVSKPIKSNGKTVRIYVKEN